MFRKLLLALAAPLLVMGACANEADDRAGVDTVGEAAALRAVPDLVAEAGTSRFEMTMAFDVPGEGAFEMKAEGVQDVDAQRMAMKLDLGSMIAGLGGGADLPPGMDEPMQLVVDGDTVYLRMPMLEAFTGTSGWLSATAEELGQSTEMLGLGGTNDPTQMLETLRGVSEEIVELGTDTVRGVATTRYRVEVDLTAALAEAPEEARAQLEAQLESLGGVEGLGDIPMEIWIDDAGLPRRVTISFDDFGAAAGGFEGSMTMTMELFDYGEPVSIEVPAANEVTPMADVLGGFGGALGGGGG